MHRYPGIMLVEQIYFKSAQPKNRQTLLPPNSEQANSSVTSTSFGCNYTGCLIGGNISANRCSLT